MYYLKCDNFEKKYKLFNITFFCFLSKKNHLFIFVLIFFLLLSIIFFIYHIKNVYDFSSIYNFDFITYLIQILNLFPEINKDYCVSHRSIFYSLFIKP